jgi:transposase
MYIEEVPNRNSPPAVLLRESYREGTRTVKRTIANLTGVPKEAIEAFRLALKGIRLVPLEGYYNDERNIPHGHVEMILGVMGTLGIDTLLSSRPCKERDVVMAMIAQRLLGACSKLETTRQWHCTTLAQELAVEDADENDLYQALDWLLSRQERIENKLAKRHLGEGARVLYDVSSSSYTGRCCPLAARGYNRDKKKMPSIVYGLLTDAEGRPIAVDVYEGNTGDPATVPDQINKLQHRFGLERVVLVGDRGMLTEAQIATVKEHPQMGWISALRSQAIRELVEQGTLQLSLFDEQNLLEIHSEKYPGERLMVCYNPLLAEDRKRTRNELLAATEKDLKRIAAEVSRRSKTPLKENEIGVKVGKVLNHFKMGKHFSLVIEDNRFEFSRKAESIDEEARLDGIYVVRTSEVAENLSTEDAVRAYKSLGQVEQAFRCLKGVDIMIRPIRHRTVDHVKAHIFLCMLAYYVEWYIRKRLSSILFEDEELDQMRWSRDPVSKATSSKSTKEKKSTKKTSDGYPVHNFKSLLQDLATRCKNFCRVGEGKTAIRFTTFTEPTEFQSHVFSLLGMRCSKTPKAAPSNSA